MVVYYFPKGRGQKVEPQKLQKMLNDVFPDGKVSETISVYPDGFSARFEVPDKVGYTNFEIETGRYFKDVQVDNAHSGDFRGIGENENGRTTFTRASGSRIDRHYDDGSVREGEWKRIP